MLGKYKDTHNIHNSWNYAVAEYEGNQDISFQTPLLLELRQSTICANNRKLRMSLVLSYPILKRNPTKLRYHVEFGANNQDKIDQTQNHQD